MPATVTLASTTLAREATVADGTLRLASTSGLVPGTTHLYCEGELMSVTSLGVIAGEVNVKRGVGGTPARIHEPNATVYVGRADQFFEQDPVGTPQPAIPVSPWINVYTGGIWFAQGAALPGQPRWWQKQTVTYASGPLGVMTTTYDPTSST